MKRILSPLLILAIALPLCSCSAPDGIESFGLVAGAAIDAGENGEIILTVEVVDTAGGEQDEPAGSQFFTAAGKNIPEAGNDISAALGRRLYWAHAQIIVLGRDCAERGMEEVMEWAMFSKSPRISAPIVVAGNCTGAQLLQRKLESYPITSFGLWRIVDEARSLGRCAAMPAYKAYDSILSPSAYALLPLVEETRDGLSVTGSAVFDGYKMEGALDEQATQTYLLSQDMLEDGLITIGDISFRVVSAGCTSRIKQTGDRFGVNYAVSLRLKLERAGSSAAKEQLEQLVRDELDRRFSSLALLSGASLSCDLLGLANRLYQQQPSLYTANPDRWAIKERCDIYLDTKILIDNYGQF